MRAQRIWAVLGLVLIIGSIVCMLVGLFFAAAKDLMMQISFVGFLGAAGVLLALGSVRRRAQENEDKEE